MIGTNMVDYICTSRTHCDITIEKNKTEQMNKKKNPTIDNTNKFRMKEPYFFTLEIQKRNQK